MGKVVPHFAVRVSHGSFMADTVASPDSSGTAEKAGPATEPRGLVEELNEILRTCGLNARFGEVKEILAVLPLETDDDQEAAAVAAALRQTAANGQDTRAFYPLFYPLP